MKTEDRNSEFRTYLCNWKEKLLNSIFVHFGASYICVSNIVTSVLITMLGRVLLTMFERVAGALELNIESSFNSNLNYMHMYTTSIPKLEPGLSQGFNADREMG